MTPGKLRRIQQIAMCVEIGIFLFAVSGAAQIPAQKLAVTSEKQTASASTSASLAGSYDGNERELAAHLILSGDGHFDYELAYGALDESARGTWVFRQGAVFLTTLPVIVPPRFTVVSDTPDTGGSLWISILHGPLVTETPQRVYLFYGPGEPQEVVEIGNDDRVPLAANRHPTRFALEIPIFGTASAHSVSESERPPPARTVSAE